ncbi:MAG TPA: PRC-barrel domain-containing protein [Thermoanaerobaculia bacterium]
MNDDDQPDLHLDRIPTGQLDDALPASPLTPLRRLHSYRIAEGDPDVRGWRVLGADGKAIGEVDELLVDREALRVRYLDVTLDSSLFGDAVTAPVSEAARSVSSQMAEAFVRGTLSETENALVPEHLQDRDTRHVLIPIGNARLDPEHDRIVVEGLRAADAPGLPDYHGQPVSRDFEAGVRQRFDSAYAHTQEHDFYTHDLYDEDRFYAPRRTARVAGLAPGRGAAPPSREITGELDRAVNAPNHDVTRDREGAPHEDAALPVRGR